MNAPTLFVCLVAFLGLLEGSAEASATPEIQDAMTRLFASDQVKLDQQKTFEHLELAIELLSQQADHDSWSKLALCQTLVKMAFPDQARCFDKNLHEGFDLPIRKIAKWYRLSPSENVSSNAIDYIEYYRKQQLELCSKDIKAKLNEGLTQVSRDNQKQLSVLKDILDDHIKKPKMEMITNGCADFMLLRYKQVKLMGDDSYQKSYLKLITLQGRKSFVRDFELFIRQPCLELVACLKLAKAYYDLLGEFPTNFSLDEDTRSWLSLMESCEIITVNSMSTDIENRVYNEQSNRLLKTSFANQQQEGLIDGGRLHWMGTLSVL